jgi:hypothetical protein
MPLLRFIVVAFLASASVPLALAEPLDRESCLNLETAQKRLLTREMQAALEHGPDWVKDHLETGEIEKVREFLEIEEMLKFRCRGGGLVRRTTATTTAGTDVVPLPDRKPAPPASVAIGNAATPPPDRKPGASSAKSSQTVADSVKTAPSKRKATR